MNFEASGLFSKLERKSNSVKTFLEGIPAVLPIFYGNNEKLNIRP